MFGGVSYVSSRRTWEIASCKMKRKSDLDFKLTKPELKPLSVVSVPHFPAVDINSCTAVEFAAENFDEYFIHFMELEFQKNWGKLWSSSCLRFLGLQWCWNSPAVRGVSLVDGTSKGFYMPRPKCKLWISMLFSLQLIAFVTPSGFLIFLHWPYQWKLNHLETVPDAKFTERLCLCNGLQFWE